MTEQGRARHRRGPAPSCLERTKAEDVNMRIEPPDTSKMLGMTGLLLSTLFILSLVLT